MKKHIFTYYHSFVIFLYFCGVIIFSMSNLHPVYISISFLAGGLYYIYLKGIIPFLKSIIFYVPLFLIIALINPFTNSLGLTVLFYIKDHPITLEAVSYGLCEGGMLVCVILWFACYTEVMSSDKFLGLFGKIAPTVSLMLSMVLRYIPDNITKTKEIRIAQQSLIGFKSKNINQKLKLGVRISSVLMGSNLESSIETADSMRGRGYGLKKRSQYTYEKFNVHDIISLTILISLIAANVYFIFIKADKFNFYPTITPLQDNIFIYALYAVLLLYPLILEGKEQILWMRSHL